MQHGPRSTGPTSGQKQRPDPGAGAIGTVPSGLGDGGSAGAGTDRLVIAAHVLLPPMVAWVDGGPEADIRPPTHGTSPWSIGHAPSLDPELVVAVIPVAHQMASLDIRGGETPSEAVIEVPDDALPATPGRVSRLVTGLHVIPTQAVGGGGAWLFGWVSRRHPPGRRLFPTDRPPGADVPAADSGSVRRFGRRPACAYDVLTIGEMSLPAECTATPGDVAQLARAPALQAGGRGFESHHLHHCDVPDFGGRIQRVWASNSASISDGFMYPRVARGRSVRLRGVMRDPI